MFDGTLPVTRIQKFCTQDGPGIRTTVFLKGCPLRCRWCHNPETQSPAPQLLFSGQLCVGCGACAAVCSTHAHRLTDGVHDWNAADCTGCGRCAAVCCTGACETAAQPMSTAQILQTVLQDAAFYGSEGGLTLSGGEPLYHAEGSLALLQAAKSAGLNTAVETCGAFDPALLPPLAKVIDLFLWDYKDSDPARHKEYAGVSNEGILRNLRRLDELGGRTRLRCILVAGVNLCQQHLCAIADTALSLKHCVGVDLLPYHAYGGSKAVALGLPDPARPEWIPTEQAMQEAAAYLRGRGVPVG